MQKLPKMYPQQFLLKSDDVVNSPKNHPKYLGYFCKKIVTKSFQKSANLVALEMNNRIVPIVKHVNMCGMGVSNFLVFQIHNN